MKNLVEEWAKSMGYKIEDTTKNQINATVEWILEIKNSTNNIVCFTDKQNLEILHFQTHISFSPEHSEKTANMSNEEYNLFILNMTDRLAYLNCDWAFNPDKQNPKKINGLSIRYFITYDSADKNSILQLISRVFISQSQMVRAISITLNKGGEPTTNSGQNNSPSIYG